MQTETTIRLRAIQHEVPASKRGRPSYRWTTRYLVVHPDGVEEYGPVTRAEGYARARELGATKVEIV